MMLMLFCSLRLIFFRQIQTTSKLQIYNRRYSDVLMCFACFDRRLNSGVQNAVIAAIAHLLSDFAQAECFTETGLLCCLLYIDSLETE